MWSRQRRATMADCESYSQVSRIQGLMAVLPSRACSRKVQLPAVSMRNAAESKCVFHAMDPGSHGGRVTAVVVVQEIEDGAIVVAHLGAHVVAGAAVDLVEQLFLRLFGIRLRRADAAKQRG